MYRCASMCTDTSLNLQTNTFSYHQYNDILILYNSTAHNVNT